MMTVNYDDMTLEEWEYAGKPERRKEQRRQSTDRREMLRFELEKEDRRSGKDRRQDFQSGWDGGTTI
jgi:hypothetical protein